MLHPILIEPVAKNRLRIFELIDQHGPPHALVAIDWGHGPKAMPRNLFVFSPLGMPSLSYVAQMVGGTLLTVGEQLGASQRAGKRGYGLEEQAIWARRDAAIAQRIGS